jgi:hypothetical protein
MNRIDDGRSTNNASDITICKLIMAIYIHAPTCSEKSPCTHPQDTTMTFYHPFIPFDLHGKTLVIVSVAPLCHSQEQTD